MSAGRFDSLRSLNDRRFRSLNDQGLRSLDDPCRIDPPTRSIDLSTEGA